MSIFAYLYFTEESAWPQSAGNIQAWICEREGKPRLHDYEMKGEQDAERNGADAELFRSFPGPDLQSGMYHDKFPCRAGRADGPVFLPAGKAMNWWKFLGVLNSQGKNVPLIQYVGAGLSRLNRLAGGVKPPLRLLIGASKSWQTTTCCVYLSEPDTQLNNNGLVNLEEVVTDNSTLRDCIKVSTQVTKYIR